jgi:response regulator RpfG family c-di-GMP phosphodiesterase
MPSTPRSLPAARLAELLLEAGRISAESFEACLTRMNLVGGRIEDVMLEVGAISEADLLKFLAARHKTRFVSTEKLAKADIDRATLDMIPRKLAEQSLVFPVLYNDKEGSLALVTCDPDNLEAIREVQMAAKVKEVKAFVARPAAVKAAIAKSYGGDIHAFALLDKNAHAQFQSMLNVYERNLISDESMATSLAGTRERERTLTQREMESSTGVAVSAGSGSHGESYLETLNVLVTLIENNRPDLRGHSGHVARLTKKMCERVQLGPAETHAIIAAAHVHDLGKMGPYHLTALNVSEYEGHRVAAEKAAQTPKRLLNGCSLSSSTIKSLDSMYERFDGKGIPGEYTGKEIPLGGRILAIADTYADLTQNPRNPFRKILRPLEACEVLGKFKGSVFDPNLVDLFKLTVTGDDLKGRLLGDRHSVLLVDPDPEETTVLELRLLEQGFLVKIARSPEQAMRSLLEGDTDIVVSELDLQPQDGFALLEEVRKQPWGKELLWVILTQRQGRTEAQRGFELGVVDYVSKPANPDVFVAKLKQMLEQSALKGTSGGRGVSGSLEEMSLPDIVQVLWHGRKTGALKVRSGGEMGEIHFVEGNIFNALWGKLRGEEAFYAMVGLQKGDFALMLNFKAPSRVIQESPEGLLLEGMRRIDEGVGVQ